MATCYRHPSRETGVSCSNCGRPICPDCMTTDARRHALSGVRQTEHQSRAPARDGLAAARHLRADRDQRRRVPHRAGPVLAVQRQRHLRQGHRTKACSTARRSTSATSTGGWSRSGFLHENFLHIGFNMYLLYLLGLMLEPAIGSVRFAAVYFTALLAGSFGALLATGRAEPRRLGRGLRADGRDGRRAARAAAQRDGVGHRRADRDQPDLQLHAREHLRRRARRRADRRRAGGPRAARGRRPLQGARPARLRGAVAPWPSPARSPSPASPAPALPELS